MDPYIIVGNGVAAINAVEAIRKSDEDTQIIMFTDQECVFYSRPSLYYAMLGRIELDDTQGRPNSFYERNGIELHCGATVTGIDPDARTVQVGEGAAVSYSKLLLANGTRGRALPWSEQPLRGIVALHTLADVTSITQLLSDSKGAIIVGGGLTSIELVEVCRHWGVPTTFVMRGPRLLDQQLTDSEAELIHQRLQGGGVEVRTEEEIADVTGSDGRVSGAVTASGDEIPCDIVACTVGVIPNKELCEDAGGETEGGTVVDDHMRTTLADVYSAGDVAQLRGPDGKPLPSQMLWYVAADMGSAAGANMAGGEATYQPRVFLNVSEFCGLDFCGVGSITPGQPEVEEVIVEADRGEGRTRIVMRDGALVGVCFLGDTRLANIARGLVAKEARPRDLGSDHPLRLLLERSSS
jgi:NAD(P)H-nitrite reductase large subunit